MQAYQSGVSEVVALEEQSMERLRGWAVKMEESRVEYSRQRKEPHLMTGDRKTGCLTREQHRSRRS